MFSCADPDAFPRTAVVAPDVASQERVQERTAALVELRRSVHATKMRWNRFERAASLTMKARPNKSAPTTRRSHS